MGRHLQVLIPRSLLHELQVIALPAAYTGGQYGSEYSGDATYYGTTNDGNCGFGSDTPGMYSGMTASELRKNKMSGILDGTL